MRIELPGDPDPFVLGSDPATSHAILRGGVSGLGLPDYSTATAQRYLGDGVAGGRQTVGARTIEVDAFTTDMDVIAALAGVMAPRPDPSDVFPLALEDVIVAGRRAVWVRPDGFDWIYDEDTNQGVAGVRLMFLAEDPVIYSSPELSTVSAAASSHSFSVTNAGTHATRNGRAWRVALTASGTVVDPWMQFGSGLHRRVFFPVTLQAGQVLSVDINRDTFVGSLRMSGIPRTPNENGPDWPDLRPGANTVTMGASSGSFSVQFWSRSTWLS